MNGVLRDLILGGRNQEAGAPPIMSMRLWFYNLKIKEPLADFNYSAAHCAMTILASSEIFSTSSGL